MSALERLAAGCLLASFRGEAAPDWLLRRVEAGLGGVCLFGQNVRDREQVLALVGALRGARDGLVVAADEEGGDVTRLERATGLGTPGNAALGAVEDPALTEAVAAAIGRSLAGLGVTLDLAPVVDINSNPDNPVIGVRSFGADPDLVARHGAAFVRGLQGAGVAACAKHFPGHGDTDVDSHLALPVVRADAATLRARELVPFAASIEAGVAAVMSSHVLVPALDERPATLSGPVLSGLLRDELGFSGAVLTDALDMAGVGGEAALAHTAVAALAAGADLLCLGAGQPEAVVDAANRAIVAAVRSGALSEERVAAAAARGAALGRRPDPAAEEDLEGGRERSSAMEALSASAASSGPGLAAARRALRVEGPAPARVRGATVVELRPTPNIAAGPADHGLGDALRERDPSITVLAVREADPLPVPPSGRPVVAVVRDAARHGWQRRALDTLLRDREGAVVVELGWPAPVAHDGATLILAHGGSRVSCRAVAELLTEGTRDG